ncbi:MAG: 6-bladed beta-propeller, partial [Bacteroidales bacterium]
ACNRPKPTDRIFIDFSDRIDRSEDLSPEIEKVEFFQIGMTTPIEYPSNIRLMNDRIFFIDRGGSYRSRINAVVAVDLKGSILWKNDRKGKGPGEFQYITDLVVLPGSDQVVINDPWSNKLLFFNSDGKYLNQIEFLLKARKLVELDPGTIVANVEKGIDPNNPDQQIRYDLAFLDHKGNIINHALPNKHTGKDWFWFGETLLQGGNQLLYTNTLTYSIYEVTRDGASPRWTLDFGQYNADTARYLYAKTAADGPMVASMSESSTGVLAFRVIHTPKNLWVLVPHDQKMNLELINKKTHKISHYRKPAKTDFIYKGIPVPVFELTQNGEVILYTLTALDAREKWDELSAEQKATADPKWRKLMETIDPEGNPIIVMIWPR